MKRLRKAIRKKVYAVKLRAPNDNSGNPRRLWILYDKDGAYLGAVDEGYQGIQALRNVAPNHVELAAVDVTASQYNAIRPEFIWR